MLTDNNKRNKKMSNTLWKIRFSNYEPIDLRDIESYSIEQNVDDTSPVRDGEMNEEIEKKFKNTILRGMRILELKKLRDYEDEKSKKAPNSFSPLCGYAKSDKQKKIERELMYLGAYDEYYDMRDGRRRNRRSYVTGATYYIERLQESHNFKGEDIFKYISDDEKEDICRPFIINKREKLFTVEFYLKDRTTVKWGAYKTKEEVEIVYNKVDSYFKKTFEHFYKNLDNQEIYSL